MSVGVSVRGPGMTIRITTRTVTTRATTPVVIVTKIDTINAISLPGIVFLLPNLGPEVLGPLDGPNQLSNCARKAVCALGVAWKLTCESSSASDSSSSTPSIAGGVGDSPRSRRSTPSENRSARCCSFTEFTMYLP